MQCEHCLNHYTPCKYNSQRQKYCTRKPCRKEYKAAYAKSWRQKNPDYHKNDSDRTATYRHQKNNRRRLSSAAQATVHEVKREFVAHLHTSAKVLENQLLTFIVLLSFYAGGLLHTSASETSKRLQKCYENGVSLKESDPTLKSYLENIYERITRIDQPPSLKKNPSPLQLAGSPPDP